MKHLSVWLIPLEIMSSNFIHKATNDGFSFILYLNISLCIYIYYIFLISASIREPSLISHHSCHK
jgi:hypothetical protein